MSTAWMVNAEVSVVYKSAAKIPAVITSGVMIDGHRRFIGGSPKAQTYQVASSLDVSNKASSVAVSSVFR